MEIKEDIGKEVLSMLDKLEFKLKKKVEQQKKNSHIHLLIETNLKKKLIKEANEKSISISELCRQKLRDDTQLDRIEGKLDGILRKCGRFDTLPA